MSADLRKTHLNSFRRLLFSEHTDELREDRRDSKGGTPDGRGEASLI